MRRGPLIFSFFFLVMVQVSGFVFAQSNYETRTVYSDNYFSDTVPATNSTIDYSMTSYARGLERKCRFNYLDGTSVPILNESQILSGSMSIVKELDWISNTSFTHNWLRVDPAGVPNSYAEFVRPIVPYTSISSFRWQFVTWTRNLVFTYEYTTGTDIITLTLNQTGWDLAVKDGGGTTHHSYGSREILFDRPDVVTIYCDNPSTLNYVSVNNSEEMFISADFGYAFDGFSVPARQVKYTTPFGLSPILLGGENSGFFLPRYNTLSYGFVVPVDLMDPEFSFLDIFQTYQTNLYDGQFGEFWDLARTNFNIDKEVMITRGNDHYQLPRYEWGNAFESLGSGLGDLRMRPYVPTYTTPDWVWNSSRLMVQASFNISCGGILTYQYGSGTWALTITRINPQQWTFKWGPARSTGTIYGETGQITLTMMRQAELYGPTVDLMMFRVGDRVYMSYEDAGASQSSYPYFKLNDSYGVHNTDYYEVNGINYLPNVASNQPDIWAAASGSYPFTYASFNYPISSYRNLFSPSQQRTCVNVTRELEVNVPEASDFPDYTIQYIRPVSVSAEWYSHHNSSTVNEATAFTSEEQFPLSQYTSSLAVIYSGSNSTIATNGTYSNLALYWYPVIGGTIDFSLNLWYEANATTHPIFDQNFTIEGHYRVYFQIVIDNAGGNLVNRTLEIIGPFLMLFIFPIAFQAATKKTIFAMFGLLFGVFVLFLSGVYTMAQAIFLSTIAGLVLYLYIRRQNEIGADIFGA